MDTQFSLAVLQFLAGGIVSVITGQMAGVVFNGEWRSSLLAGYAGSDFLESLYKIKSNEMVKT